MLILKQFAALALLLVSVKAFAWDVHQVVMPYIVPSLPAHLKVILERSYSVPCEGEDAALVHSLVKDLWLNPDATFPPITGENCGKGSAVSLIDMLLGPAVDEPDHGMDRDLPEQFDLKGEREWMGGTTGPSSQGFRHMYFGGWRLLHPFATFQIPMHAMGQAPDRAQILATKAKEYYKAGNPILGARVLGWALHYIQDLTQPFHTVQAPSLRMVPWHELLSLHPKDAVTTFIKETTRTISNYHWAYEGYVRMRLKEKDEHTSPFEDCFKEPERFANLKIGRIQSPRDLALEIANASVELAPELGAAELKFFGGKLLGKDYNLPANLGVVEYDDYIRRPDLNAERDRLNKVTCRALANAYIGSMRLIEWVVHD